jgi:hypothetical protein
MLAPANDENEVLVDSEEVPHKLPFPLVLFWEAALLKHLVAAELAENGYFLLMSTRYCLPGILLT